VSVLDIIASTATTAIEQFKYWGIFIGMFLESACIPVPSEVIMPFSGFAASKNILSFEMVVIVGVIGQLAGSTAVFFVGKNGGRKIVERYGKYVLISQHDIEKADKWFERYGELTVLFTRMMPVIRTFISLPAGIANMNYLKFILYSAVGIIPWTLGLAYVGVKMGENWEAIRTVFHGFDVVIAIVLIIGIAFYLRNHFKNLNSAS
jgi:membrane protein DedA with SNARE-associated domain